MRRPILDHVLGRLEMQSADFQTIDAYVTSQMQSMHIPGVALGIVHGDKIVHLQRFGVAKPAGQTHDCAHSLVLGSTSKSFTIAEFRVRRGPVQSAGWVAPPGRPKRG